MSDSIIRYQFNPMHTDTVGFYDYCIPLTNESNPPSVDSLKKYYDFSIYNYITPPKVPKQFCETVSVFGRHELSPVHKGPLPIQRQSADWITIIFLACLFIFAWIQTSYSKRLGQIFRAVAQAHSVNQLEREGNIFSERITLGLGFIYYTISSIFVFQLTETYNLIPQGMSNLELTAIIFLGLFLYQFLKSMLVYITGIIFSTRESARQYQLNTLIFNYVIGIFLFPVTIIAFYWGSKALITVGAIVVVILMLYRFFRGILTGLDKISYNLFYLFLYLCTLEILPLVLVYKAISKF